MKAKTRGRIQMIRVQEEKLIPHSQQLGDHKNDNRSTEDEKMSPCSPDNYHNVYLVYNHHIFCKL